MSLDGYPAPDPRNLIVNYIPTPVTDADLRNLFAPFGEIESARVILDKGTGHPKGYGFVKFTSPEAAKIAIDKMNGFEVQNKRLKVTPAKGPIGQMPNTNAPASYAAARPQHPTYQQPQQPPPQMPVYQQAAYAQQPQYIPQGQQFHPQHQQLAQQHLQQHIMMPYQNTSPMMMNSVNYMWFDGSGQMRTMPVVQSMPMQAAPQQHLASLQHSSSLVPSPQLPSPQQPHLYQPTPPQRSDTQLPLFPQLVQPVIHRDGEQAFNTTSFNMTLLGVSNMGSGIVSPNGSLDGKGAR